VYESRFAKPFLVGDKSFSMKGMVAALVMDGAKTQVPPEVATFLPLVCDHCHFVIFFSALPAEFAASLE